MIKKSEQRKINRLIKEKKLNNFNCGEKFYVWKGDVIGYSYNENGIIDAINLSESNISDISFLINFPDLTHLVLVDNNIYDISVLKNLKKLYALDLSRNNITDISPLQELYDLNFLYMNKNRISDITPLKMLTNLEELDIYSNNIEKKEVYNISDLIKTK